MIRWAAGGLLWGVFLCGLPQQANAQSHPSALLQDAETFRGALRGPAANATLEDAQRVIHGQFVCDAEGIAWRQGQEGRWDAADDTLPLELRLIGALLSTEGLEDAVAALGFRLDDTLLTIDAFDATDGTFFVARIGNNHAAVAVEHDLGRTREIRIVYGNTDFRARALDYGDTGNGWFPTEVVVTADGIERLRMSVTDVAPHASSLAAVTHVATPAVDTVRFPRLPL